MDRKTLEKMTFEEQMIWAYENIEDVTTEEMLKEFAIEKIQNDYFHWGLHIINAICKNPYYTEYYRYDYNMGTLETPTPITEIGDIEDLLFLD